MVVIARSLVLGSFLMLTNEQFQLVRRWVAQGAPGPVRRIAGRGTRALKIARGPAEGPKQ